ncbi:MAG: lipid-A-disaccharide synthase, partial [Bacteroidota bacterium]|nr:lipid-A-disaccharide synthase [Bacteroidota bacterium]
MRQHNRLKVFLVAGEASGDAYGARLIEELDALCADRGMTLETVGWGGDAMKAAGMRLLTHCATINYMGFLEVAKHLPTILKNLRRAKDDVVREEPDVVLTIDFPGFNMRLAKWLRQAQHPALRVQWVAPQIWAWRSGRVHGLRDNFDAVAPILPFEQTHLRKHGVEVWSEGHPLMDLVAGSQSDERSLALALLPGSRLQEIQHHLPVLLDGALEGAMQGKWSMKDVVVAGAPGRTEDDYALAQEQGVKVVFGQTQDILQRAQVAWVASGTATLEAALLDTPHVVVYKTSAVTYFLAKRLAKVAHIGLPNLLMEQTVVAELIQHDLTADAL